MAPSERERARSRFVDMSLPGARPQRGGGQSARCANVAAPAPLCRRASGQRLRVRLMEVLDGERLVVNVNPSLAGTRASQRAGIALDRANRRDPKAIVLLEPCPVTTAIHPPSEASRTGRRTRERSDREFHPPFVDTSAHHIITDSCAASTADRCQRASGCNRADSERRTQLG